MLAAAACIPEFGTYLPLTEVLKVAFPVSTQSRSLSISRVYSSFDEPIMDTPTDRAYAWDTFLLFYENPSGRVVILQGNYLKTVVLRGSEWQNNETIAFQDLSEPFYARLRQGAWISSPFSILTSTTKNYIAGFFRKIEFESGARVSSIVGFTSTVSQARASPLRSLRSIVLITSVANGSMLQYGLGASKQNLTAGSVIGLFHSSPDWPTASLVEADSNLLYFNGEPSAIVENSLHIGQSTLSNIRFPFSRLATATTEEFTFIYHQINESLLLDERQYKSVGVRGFGEANLVYVPIE